jgi:hypothetical protein
MGLTPEQIQILLSKPAAAGRGKGRKPKNYIDTTQRTVMVWFKLAHKLFDEDTQEPARCSNPNCQDTRAKQMVAEVDGIKMCRRCFLDGYGKVSEDQESLDEATGGETSE